MGRSLERPAHRRANAPDGQHHGCLLYTSDAADERSSVDLGGRRIIKKKTRENEALREPIVYTDIKTSTQ